MSVAGDVSHRREEAGYLMKCYAWKDEHVFFRWRVAGYRHGVHLFVSGDTVSSIRR